MKLKLLCFLSAFILMRSAQVQAQSGSPATTNDQNVPEKEVRKFNFLKINLPGIALRNYSVQYERVLSKRFSVAISYRKMPSAGIPFKNLISDAVASDDPVVNDIKETIEGLRINGSAITPEIRFYLGKKGYGRGFYLAPFYRKATFETNNLAFNIKNQNENDKEISLNLSGKFTSNTGGLMMGAQWALGTYFCLDWWILGAHGGSGKGDFLGLTNQTLSQSDQEAVREELESIDIPLADKTVEVNANSASLKLRGPWGGIRGGLSIGFRF